MGVIIFLPLTVLLGRAVPSTQTAVNFCAGAPALQRCKLISSNLGLCAGTAKLSAFPTRPAAYNARLTATHSAPGESWRTMGPVRAPGGVVVVGGWMGEWVGVVCVWGGVGGVQTYNQHGDTPITVGWQITSSRTQAGQGMGGRCLSLRMVLLPQASPMASPGAMAAASQPIQTVQRGAGFLNRPAAPRSARISGDTAKLTRFPFQGP